METDDQPSGGIASVNSGGNKRKLSKFKTFANGHWTIAVGLLLIISTLCPPKTQASIVRVDQLEASIAKALDDKHLLERAETISRELVESNQARGIQTPLEYSFVLARWLVNYYAVYKTLVTAYEAPPGAAVNVSAIAATLCAGFQIAYKPYVNWINSSPPIRSVLKEWSLHALYMGVVTLASLHNGLEPTMESFPGFVKGMASAFFITASLSTFGEGLLSISLARTTDHLREKFHKHSRWVWFGSKFAATLLSGATAALVISSLHHGWVGDLGLGALGIFGSWSFYQQALDKGALKEELRSYKKGIVSGCKKALSRLAWRRRAF